MRQNIKQVVCADSSLGTSRIYDKYQTGGVPGQLFLGISTILRKTDNAVVRSTKSKIKGLSPLFRAKLCENSSG